MVFSAQNINEQETFSFTFSVVGSLSEFVLLKLFNGEGEIEIEGHELISKNLPRGLYQLHILSNEKFEQKLIRLEEDLHLNWENKGSFSSIPADFLQSTSDYYQEAVNQWSRRSTVTDLDITDGESSLFIFFRYPNERIKVKQQNVAQSMGWRFKLLNKERKAIFRLDDPINIRENIDAGWLSFNAQLDPGIYYLVYKGNSKAREIPLYVFPDWQTQFFLTFKRTPIFGTARIQLIRQDNHNELQAKETLQLDALLRNLENGIYYVPQSLISNTADRKWINPILALAVCYAYLLSPENTNDHLFRIMLRNIEERILPLEIASDLQALRLLAANHFEDYIPHIELETPCMFNIGMKVFIDYSIKYPDRITINSTCKEIISNLYNDSAWTSYKPLQRSEINVTFKISEQINNIKYININDLFEGIQPIPESNNFILDDWLSLSITSQLMVKKETAMTAKGLAQQFQVSQSMVENSIDKIKNELFYNNNQNLLDSTSVETNILKDNLSKIITDDLNNFRQ